MDNKLLNRLLAIRDIAVLRDGTKLKYKLVSFGGTTMFKDAIPETPFRTFESVPQGRPSKRRQNNTMSFDPYVDTLFDYPLIVNSALSGGHDALNELNWHLTLQVPYCGMDCWHCYNDKRVCSAGIDDVLEVKGDSVPTEWTAEGILEAFAECRKQGRANGRVYNILRISGGEPFLATELMAETLQLIHENSQKPNPNRNQDYPLAVWTETNLISWAETKNGRSVVKVACEESTRRGLDIRAIFKACSDKFIVHPCFHGLSDENLQQCTGNSSLSLSDLHCGFRRLHEFMADSPSDKITRSPNIYPTFVAEACDPSGIARFFDFLYDVHPAYPLRVAVISVDDYEPIEHRMAQRTQQKKPFFCYARHAGLKRWDDAIKSKYGIAYGQIPRAMVDALTISSGTKNLGDTGNSNYEPVLFILKSVFRDEYRQELLTTLAAPPGTHLSTSYDTGHIEPSTRICLKGGLDALHAKPLTVLIAYSNPDSSEDRSRFLPLRWGTLREVHVTDQLAYFKIELHEYVSLPPTSESRNKTLLEDFSFRMREYFGSRILLERPTIRWVLLGEQNYILRRHVDSSRQEKTWDNILSCIQKNPGFSGLRERSVFLQVINPLVSDSKDSDISLKSVAQKRSLKEGDKTQFSVRYYVPDFGYYDKKPDDRTLSITSNDNALSIEGYECRPLSKYGEIHFGVVCGALSHSREASIIIESKNGSPHCPRVEVPLLLKKATASDG